MLPASHCVLAGRVRLHRPLAFPRGGGHRLRLGDVLTELRCLVRGFGARRRSAGPFGERGERRLADKRSGNQRKETEGGFKNDRCGARSVAGRMTALSRARSVRGHGCQTHHCALRTGGATYKLAVWARFLCLLSLRRQRKWVPPRTGATRI